MAGGLERGKWRTTAVASTMAHQMPPMPLPHIPRIRPPRMLKGDPSPNTNPQPPGEASGFQHRGRWVQRVWVQGRWRNPASNAAKHRLEVQTKQATKAVRHETHGLNIYAYRHIRTNQVVYSLTRTLQVSKYPLPTQFVTSSFLSFPRANIQSFLE